MGVASLKRNAAPSKQHGYALYAVGISAWMMLVACLGSTYMHPLLPAGANADIYVISQQAAYVLSYFVFFAFGWRHQLERMLSFWKISAVALVGSIVLFALIAMRFDALPWIAACGILTGVGTTAGYMQWIRIIVDRPKQEILSLLFIASIASSISGALFVFFPIEARFCAFIALVLFSLVLMFQNTIRVECNTSNSAMKVNKDRLTSTIAIPIVCSIALVLVAPIASTTYVDTIGQDTFRTVLAQAANCVTLALFAIVFFGLKREIRIFDAYCAFLPILASSVLIAPLFEPSQRWFVLFLGDMCFCAVSFLVLLTTCEISRRLNVSSVVVYGLLGGFVYLARIPEMFLVVNPGFAPETLTPFAIAALLLYVLAMPAFFLPFFNKKAKNDWEHLTSTFTTSDVNASCEALAAKYRLPSRQAEVLKLLAAGHSVSHIADTLCLSENTVKTYRKAIYAALDIHSRQALLDRVHEEMKL